MTWLNRIWLAALPPLVFLATPAGLARQAPDPAEVYAIIHTNLTGITDAQLQTAAVDGLVKELQPRVWLVGEAAVTNAATRAPVLRQATVFDGPVAYFRIGRVGPGLAQDLRSAYAAMARTNAPAGLVLDLRFADGDDYPAAAAVADLFTAKAQPLLDWGTGSASATQKEEALKPPVAILVNHQTAEAAEELAAMLRDVGAGLVIGTNTAGRAMRTEDFPLSNGQRLRIARTGIKLGSGAVLSAAGVEPDIRVAVSARDEQAYWTDPFKDLANTNRPTASADTASSNVPGATNRPPRRRINEAELVRERREGVDLSLDTGPDRAEPAPRVVRDPALARALDLIKGLAVVRQLRGP